jgi:hypothetical protein
MTKLYINKSSDYYKTLTTIGEQAVSYDMPKNITKGLTAKEKRLLKALLIKLLNSLDE